MQEVVQTAVNAVAVLDEVAAGLVDALELGEHLAHRLHDETDAAIPCGHHERLVADGPGHVGLPVGRLGRLVAGRIEVGRRRHAGRRLAPVERRLTCRREEIKKIHIRAILCYFHYSHESVLWVYSFC